MREINNIAIVGVGLIGGSIGLALKRKGFKGVINGVSREESVNKAVLMGAIDRGFSYHDIAKAVEDSDVIFLCTPISRINNLIKQISVIGSKLKKDCIISDVGSTKSKLCEYAAEGFPDNLCFIGGHPMTGSEKSGIDAADPFLFENSIYILTPGKNVPADIGHGFASFVQKLGAKVIIMDSGVHDKIAAVISHVPQLLSVALVNWAAKHNKEKPLTLQLAAGGFRDMTRIASSSFSMWKDIIETNQLEIERHLDEFINELKLMKLDLQTGKLSKQFDSARSIRHTIPKDSKGFLRPLHEILVIVDDRPGVIAEISGALAKISININDIEVVKVREGEGGTLRLGFESLAAANKAIEVLNKLDYKTRLRE